MKNSLVSLLQLGLQFLFITFQVKKCRSNSEIISSKPKVLLGNIVLRDNGYKELVGKRVGILTNPTGSFQDSLVHIVDDMALKSDFHLVCVFGPEHGFRGDKQAENSDSYFYKDEETGLPGMELYITSEVMNMLSLNFCNSV